MKVDYNKIYSSYSEENIDYVKRTGLWKAKNICKLIKDEPAESILGAGGAGGGRRETCRCTRVGLLPPLKSSAP